MDEDYQNSINEWQDEEVREIMASHDLDEETAERVCEAMDEYGVDEDDAIEIVDEGF
jgi:Spy/CpxP family protein refolding chaperone